MTQPSAGHAADHRIIVVVPDEPGSLAQVTEALTGARLNIEHIEGRAVGGMGLITLSTDDDDAALRALLEAKFRAVTSDYVVFHLPDRPGALAGAAQIFAEHRINVRTIHIVHRLGGEAIVAVTTDDDEAARALLDPESLL